MWNPWFCFGSRKAFGLKKTWVASIWTQVAHFKRNGSSWGEILRTPTAKLSARESVTRCACSQWKLVRCFCRVEHWSWPLRPKRSSRVSLPRRLVFGECTFASSKISGCSNNWPGQQWWGCCIATRAIAHSNRCLTSQCGNLKRIRIKPPQIGKEKWPHDQRSPRRQCWRLNGSDHGWLSLVCEFRLIQRGWWNGQRSWRKCERSKRNRLFSWSSKTALLSSSG